MKIIFQMWRGCGHLPHVGEHPGTLPVIFFLLMGGIAGGWVGTIFMGIWLLPLYLHGAYERAQLSDSLCARGRFSG